MELLSVPQIPERALALMRSRRQSLDRGTPPASACRRQPGRRQQHIDIERRSLVAELIQGHGPDDGVGNPVCIEQLHQLFEGLVNIGSAEQRWSVAHTPRTLAGGHGTPPAARICFSSSVQLMTTRSLPPFEPRRIMMKRPSGMTS